MLAVVKASPSTSKWPKRCTGQGSRRRSSWRQRPPAAKVTPGAMSHELRTPLTAILGFAELVSRLSVTAPTRNVAIIHRSEEHLLGLINDILTSLKIEAGRVELQRSAAWCCSAWRMFDTAAQKGLTVVFDLAADVPALSTQTRVNCGKSILLGRHQLPRRRHHPEDRAQTTP